MELKWKSDLSHEELEKLSTEALKQINDNRYESELCGDGVKSIIKLGIAFSKKNVVITPENA